jgi:bifunctional non-homologous end joining protein LigD
MEKPLQRYRRMRDFERTPEPSGSGRAAGKRARRMRHRYYIQRHDATRLHYDFRLELDGVLKSWAVPKGPSLDPRVRRLAVEVEDHPLEYGEFEGRIPEKQYGAGEVLLWDKGEWQPLDSDPAAALRKGRLHFALDGRKLHGSWVLARTRKDEKKPQWLLIKRDDDAARAGSGAEVVLEHPESVKERRKDGKGKPGSVPAFLPPMLATLVTEPPSGGDWIYEVKHDGYRILARLSGGEARLFSRTGKEWTAKLPHVARALAKLKLDGTWLDGEIVVPGEAGRSDFQALQNAFDAGSDAKIVYYVFDAPFLEGRDQRALPLEERKRALERAVKFAEPLRYSPHLEANARDALEQACRMGLEGLIGKEARSSYVSARSRSWIKLKCRQRQDFVIGGYTDPGGSRQGFGALLVGVYGSDGSLRYAGKVGTGFDDELLLKLKKKFSSMERKNSPFENPPREKGVHWLDPKLVAEIAFAERTKDGILRQAAFMGLRKDLPPEAVHEEKAQAPDSAPDIRITHPDRVVWTSPKITKLDLAQYYKAVTPWILPHLAGRPLTLVRCPDGAEKKCFYQRHLLMGASPGELKTVKRAAGKRGAYLYLDSAGGLLSAVQNNAIEFHTWGAVVPDIGRPDRITMDLDPGEGVTWKQLVEAARLTKKLLEGVGLECFLKTTGGKGLHVVAPIEPGLPWDDVKEFTRDLARMLVRARPDLFIDTVSKSKRGGRIFVDYLRNAETASAVAAYSARARPGATVSMPLAWKELGRADVRARYTVRTVPRLLARRRADPWAGYEAARRPVTRKMRQALSGSR